MSLTKTSFSMLNSNIVNTKDYGLKFDDDPASATFNSAALSRALSDAAGKTLYIDGNGTAYVNASSVGANNTRVIGSRSAVLKRFGSGTWPIFEFGTELAGATNIVLENIVVDINAVNDYTSGISFKNSSKVVVKNCSFLNSGSITPGWTLTGFIARGTSNLIVDGNYAYRCQIKCGGESASGVGRNIAIVNNISEEGFFHGISCVTTSNTLLEDVVIANNVLRNSYGNAIMCGQDGENGVNATIRNIKVHNNSVYTPQSDNYAAIVCYRAATTDNISISDNSIYAISPGSNTTGIAVASDAANSLARNVVISGNIVTNRTQDGIRIDLNCKDAVVADNVLIGTRGIRAQEGCTVTIANNVIDGAGINSRGMRISDCEAEIIGNTVKNCATGTFAGAIELTANAGKTLKVNLINNRAYDDQTPKTQMWAVQEIATGTINSRYTNNDFSGNGSGPYYNFAPPIYTDFSVGTVSPSAPAANSAIVYVDKPGAKVRLMARFPTGAAQQLAIEP